jgi:hypothetical protein
MLPWRRKSEPPTPAPSPDQVETEPEFNPILENLGSAREQAAALVAALVDAGFSGKALPIDRLVDIHLELCNKRSCPPRGWFAVSRELKRMGLAKWKIWVSGNLVTYYLIAEPAGNVVELKRA